MGRTGDSCLPQKWHELVVSPLSVFVFAQGCYFTVLQGADKQCQEETQDVLLIMEQQKMLFAPAAGILLHRHCALCTKLLEWLCDQDPLGFPTNHPPALISKEEKWQNTNIQLQKCKQQNFGLFTFFSSWSLGAGLCSKLVLTSSTALQVYSMRAEPLGGRVREAVSLLDLPVFSAVLHEVNQIGSMGKLFF